MTDHEWSNVPPAISRNTSVFPHKNRLPLYELRSRQAMQELEARPVHIAAFIDLGGFSRTGFVRGTYTKPGTYDSGRVWDAVATCRR